MVSPDLPTLLAILEVSTLLVACGVYTSDIISRLGSAIKIKTDEGNLDWVFNNTPVFFIRDPAKFPHFIHTQKRDPQTHLKDADMFWVSTYLRRYEVIMC